MANATNLEQKKQQALANAAKAAAARDEALRKLRATPPRTDTMYLPAGIERGGCILVNGRWWPKDSTVARNRQS